MNKTDIFELKNYDKAKQFSDFLPGIAGADGIPMWTFFVNRGQCVCSLGVENKDGAILEFMPANKAYQTVEQTGFRTFLKFGGEKIELFTADNSEKNLYSMHESLTITETFAGKYEAAVTYVQLAGEDFPALLRKLVVKNLSDKSVKIFCADGLAQILPLGAKYDTVKNVTNLLSAYSTAELVNGAVLYRHEYTTADTAEVKKNNGGNFYTAVASGKAPYYVYDPDVVFGGDLSLNESRGFFGATPLFIREKTQSLVFKLPCAFSLFDFELAPDESFEIVSAIGSITDIARLEDVEKITHAPNFFDRKLNEMKAIVTDLFKCIDSSTADKTLDAYFKQSFFDNALRGGIPTHKGGGTSYIYARKHGDLEREYNWFVIPACKNSCGNGNYRDICQNRRNDLFFYPFIEDHNIKLFYNLLQADGYNPLIVEPNGCAAFSEGYWSDHFVYPLDLLINYLHIYPENSKKVLMGGKDYTYFDSGVYVLPLSERLERTEKGIRSYRSIVHDRKEGLLKMADGTPITVSLITKLYGCALIKSSMLDNTCTGIEMDGGKPGWNDSLNGLPGINGSSVPEAIGLYKLNKFIIHETSFADEVELLTEHAELFTKLAAAADTACRYKSFLAAREQTRLTLRSGVSRGTVKVSGEAVRSLLVNINKKIEAALTAAKEAAGGIYPTFFAWEITDGKKYGTIDFENLTRRRVDLPLFLEGAAKGLSLCGISDAEKMHKEVLSSDLFDKKLKVYKTGVSLKNQTPEIGRVRLFSAGLYERESCFVHMHYKYILGLLEAENYDAFYSDVKTALVCRMDSKVYGRNPLQNSSFIVSSASSDPKLWGKGFQPRLSGANAELLSMYVLMFVGKKLFSYDGTLKFTFAPALHSDLFDSSNEASAKLFNCRVTYFNPLRLSTYTKDAKIASLEVITDKETKTVPGDTLSGVDAEKLRSGEIKEIRASVVKV